MHPAAPPLYHCHHHHHNHHHHTTSTNRPRQPAKRPLTNRPRAAWPGRVTWIDQQQPSLAQFPVLRNRHKRREFIFRTPSVLILLPRKAEEDKKYELIKNSYEGRRADVSFSPSILYVYPGVDDERLLAISGLFKSRLWLTGRDCIADCGWPIQTIDIRSRIDRHFSSTFRASQVRLWFFLGYIIIERETSH